VRPVRSGASVSTIRAVDSAHDHPRTESPVLAQVGKSSLEHLHVTRAVESIPIVCVAATEPDQRHVGTQVVLGGAGGLFAVGPVARRHHTCSILGAVSMRTSEEITVCDRGGCGGPVRWEIARVAQAKGLSPSEANDHTPTVDPLPRSRVGTCLWCGRRYRAE
jgi:hypothetical protein